MQPTGSQPSLQAALASPDRFIIAVELETSRGLVLDGRARRVYDYARQLKDAGLADAFSLTDNPGGHPHLRPETLGRSLLELGCEVIVNVSCKDYNRNGLESRLWSLASSGFQNVLALTGDFPSQGIGGQARPVFDVDSAGLLAMVRQINLDLLEAATKATASRVPSPSLGGPLFFPGAAVNPFKRSEGEYVTQLMKLDLKAKLGAKWVVTQIGFDARKQDELLRYLRLKGNPMPALGTVFMLGVQSARAFNRWAVPGVCLPDALLSLCEKQAASPDKGRAFFEELAAKQVAVLRGLGYRGAHISGRPDFERVQRVLEMERGFARDDWRAFAKEVQFPQPGEFYYFEPDGDTGLSTDEVSRAYLASRRGPATALRRFSLSPAFHLGRAVHAVALGSHAPAAGPGRAAFRLVGRSRAASRVVHTLEQVAKVPLYQCKDCGDCSLPELAYLCPESQCAKNQRNGPCGGTRAGRCEVLDKECVWVRAYDRLKAYGEEDKMLDRPVVITDASLRGTSSWSNALLGRDHASQAPAGAQSAAAPVQPHRPG